MNNILQRRKKTQAADSTADAYPSPGPGSGNPNIRADVTNPAPICDPETLPDLPTLTAEQIQDLDLDNIEDGRTKLRHIDLTVMDHMLVNPSIKQKTLAAMLHINVATIRNITQNDMFQTVLNDTRKAQHAEDIAAVREIGVELAIKSAQVLSTRMTEAPDEIPTKVVLEAYNLAAQRSGTDIKSPAPKTEATAQGNVINFQIVSGVPQRDS